MSSPAGSQARPTDRVWVERVYEPSQWASDPLRAQRRRRRRRIALGFAIPVLVLAAWETFAAAEVIDTLFFPPPSATLGAAWLMIQDGRLLGHVWATMFRVLRGYVLGAALGAVVGLLMGRYWTFGSLLKPSFTGLYTVPKLGVFPLLLLLFGVGETAGIVLVGYGTFLMVGLSAFDASRGVPGGYLDVGKVFRASRIREMAEIVLPATAPALFTSLRLAMGYAILVIIGVEMISSETGVGYLVWHSWRIFQPAEMFVGIIVSALLGAAAIALIGLLQRVCLPWAPAESSDGGR